MSALIRFGYLLAEAGYFFRRIAFEVDRDPTAILQYQQHAALQILIYLEQMTSVERVKIYEALSYGDSGVLLACRLIKTFNQMRPCVGALAIGVAQAMVDYVIEINILTLSKGLYFLRKLQSIINAARNVLYFAAEQVDQDFLNNSCFLLAKVRAIEVAKYVVSSLCDCMNPLEIFSHPFMMKWYRDVWRFELI